MAHRIAIVDNGGFSTRWIAYCRNHSVPYKTVDPYANDIISQLSDCTAFMWHHSHRDYRDALFANQLLYALSQKGMKVFPDFPTTWHFDDKVGQKYLLEAAGLPLVPTYVFYTKREALDWVDSAAFPKVFKLKGGSGSMSVSLVRSRAQARRKVRKAFSCGFPPLNSWDNLREHVSRFTSGKGSLAGVLKGVGRLFVRPEYDRMHPVEKGYCYFQDFIPDNLYDIRVCVVNHKAFAIKRMVRENDFRASGSGSIVYGRDQIDERCVALAFEAARKFATQCVGIDFVFSPAGQPMIVEISYGFTPEGYDACDGYWTEDMAFVPEPHFDFCGWMVESVMEN